MTRFYGIRRVDYEMRARSRVKRVCVCLVDKMHFFLLGGNLQLSTTAKFANAQKP